MKAEENKNEYAVSIEEVPIAVQDETGATEYQFSKAHLAFISQAITTLEASLVDKTSSHTLRKIPYIVLSSPKKDGSKATKHTYFLLVESSVAKWFHSMNGEAWKRCRGRRDVRWRSRTHCGGRH